MAQSEQPQRHRLEVGAAWLGKAVYFVVATTLLLVALSLIGISIWTALTSFGSDRPAILVLLDAVGVMVLGLAIVDVSKYLIEEEVLHDRELRLASEARGALTKFLLIITIVVSLEAVILIFETLKGDNYKDLIYPTLLFSTAVAIVIALGVYQYLSAKAQQAAGTQAALRADDADHLDAEGGRERGSAGPLGQFD